MQINVIIINAKIFFLAVNSKFCNMQKKFVCVPTELGEHYIVTIQVKRS